MAAAIIEAITSGFGLIQDLATNLLTAFGTLFWDATLNEGAGGLTTFATFALIMMSISVVFGVVSLVLNLIRSNTGVN
jgi:hypothetical protein